MSTTTGVTNGATTHIKKGEKLLEVQDLKMHFPITRGIIFQRQVGAIKAVDGIDFTLYRGETLGLVGESCVVNLPPVAPFSSYTGQPMGRCSLKGKI